MHKQPRASIEIDGPLKKKSPAKNRNSRKKKGNEKKADTTSKKSLSADELVTICQYYVLHGPFYIN